MANGQPSSQSASERIGGITRIEDPDKFIQERLQEGFEQRGDKLVKDKVETWRDPKGARFGSEDVVTRRTTIQLSDGRPTKIEKQRVFDVYAGGSPQLNTVEIRRFDPQTGQIQRYSTFKRDKTGRGVRSQRIDFERGTQRTRDVKRERQIAREGALDVSAAAKARSEREAAERARRILQEGSPQERRRLLETTGSEAGRRRVREAILATDPAAARTERILDFTGARVESPREFRERVGEETRADPLSSLPLQQQREARRERVQQATAQEALLGFAGLRDPGRSLGRLQNLSAQEERRFKQSQKEKSENIINNIAPIQRDDILLRSARRDELGTNLSDFSGPADRRLVPPQAQNVSAEERFGREAVDLIASPFRGAGKLLSLGGQFQTLPGHLSSQNLFSRRERPQEIGILRRTRQAARDPDVQIFGLTAVATVAGLLAPVTTLFAGGALTGFEVGRAAADPTPERLASATVAGGTLALPAAIRSTRRGFSDVVERRIGIQQLRSRTPPEEAIVPDPRFGTVAFTPPGSTAGRGEIKFLFQRRPDEQPLNSVFPEDTQFFQDVGKAFIRSETPLGGRQRAEVDFDQFTALRDRTFQQRGRAEADLGQQGRLTQFTSGSGQILGDADTPRSEGLTDFVSVFFPARGRSADPELAQGVTLFDRRVLQERGREVGVTTALTSERDLPQSVTPETLFRRESFFSPRGRAIEDRTRPTPQDDFTLSQTFDVEIPEVVDTPTGPLSQSRIEGAGRASRIRASEVEARKLFKGSAENIDRQDPLFFDAVEGDREFIQAFSIFRPGRRAGGQDLLSADIQKRALPSNFDDILGSVVTRLGSPRTSGASRSTNNIFAGRASAAPLTTTLRVVPTIPAVRSSPEQITSPLRQQSRSQTRQAQARTTRTAQRQPSAQRTGLLTGLRSLQGLGTSQIDATTTRTQTGQQTRQIPGLGEITTPRTTTIPGITSIPRITTTSTTTSIPRITTVPPPRPPQPPRRPGFFSLRLPGDPQPQKKVPGFDVFVKVKGKFQKANKKPLDRRAALNRGAGVVDNTVHRTFKIEKADKKATPTTGGLFAAFNKRDFKKKGKRFIEKSSATIDTLGELQGITFKGIRARRRNNRRRSGGGLFDGI